MEQVLGGSMDELAEAAGGAGADAGPGAVLEGLQGPGVVDLSLPAFDIEWQTSLAVLLQGLGMELAFTDGAGFSGITTREHLLISDVVHKVVITVDAEGMEVAAATAVGMEEAAAPEDPKELVLDSLFLFIAYETSTLAPLVLGWIGDPSQTR